MIIKDPEIRGSIAGEQPVRLPARRTMEIHLKAAQRMAGLRGEVNVLLTTDAKQKALNQQFRGKNKTTDVLSFPAPAEAGYAGDISISLAVARVQAVEHGHALLTELKVLILHGVLHLAGHDHESDGGEMAALEEKLRAKLKLPSGLIGRAASHRRSAPKSPTRPARRRTGAARCR